MKLPIRDRHHAGQDEGDGPGSEAKCLGVLQGGNFTSVRMPIEAIAAFVASWNQNAAPFEWTKAEVHRQQMKRYYSDLCN